MKPFQALTSLFAISQSIPKYAHFSLRFKASFLGDFDKNITKPAKNIYEETQFNDIFLSEQKEINNQKKILKALDNKKQTLRSAIHSNLVLKMRHKNKMNPEDLNEKDMWIGCLAPSLEMGIDFNDIFCDEKKMKNVGIIKEIAKKVNNHVKSDTLSALMIASHIINKVNFDPEFLLEKKSSNKNKTEIQFILRGEFKGKTLYFLLIPKKNTELALVDIARNPLNLKN